MKEQGINSQDQINEQEISNLSVRDFRIMIGKMFQRLKIGCRKYKKKINS